MFVISGNARQTFLCEFPSHLFLYAARRIRNRINSQISPQRSKQTRNIHAHVLYRVNKHLGELFSQRRITAVGICIISHAREGLMGAIVYSRAKTRASGGELLPATPTTTSRRDNCCHTRRRPLGRKSLDSGRVPARNCSNYPPSTGQVLPRAVALSLSAACKPRERERERNFQAGFSSSPFLTHPLASARARDQPPHGIARLTENLTEQQLPARTRPILGLPAFLYNTRPPPRQRFNA